MGFWTGDCLMQHDSIAESYFRSYLQNYWVAFSSHLSLYTSPVLINITCWAKFFTRSRLYLKKKTFGFTDRSVWGILNIYFHFKLKHPPSTFSNINDQVSNSLDPYETLKYSAPQRDPSCSLCYKFTKPRDGNKGV